MLDSRVGHSRERGRGRGSDVRPCYCPAMCFALYKLSVMYHRDLNEWDGV